MIRFLVGISDVSYDCINCKEETQNGIIVPDVQVIEMEFKVLLENGKCYWGEKVLKTWMQNQTISTCNPFKVIWSMQQSSLKRPLIHTKIKDKWEVSASLWRVISWSAEENVHMSQYSNIVRSYSTYAGIFGLRSSIT